VKWSCLEDREPLISVNGDRLRCPRCGNEHDVVDGFPVFTRGESERRAVELASPSLETLWQAMRNASTEDVAARFCREHGCTRSDRDADWKFFLPVPPEGTVLELGAGFGDDSRDLAGRPGATVSIVPRLTNARVVRHHLGERAGPVIVMADVGRLPLPDGSVDAIALEDAAAPGFGLTNGRLEPAAREWKRVLSPGGVVLIGVTGDLFRVPGMRRLWARVRARAHPESFNRQVKRWASGGGSGGLGVGRTIRTMTRLGFPRPVVYAPLPDQNETRAVLPIEEASVVRYFLNHMIRRNSRAVRVGLVAANAAVTLGVFRHLTPYAYLIFHRDSPT
jgi:SAM-dependent methyltransferase